MSIREEMARKEMEKRKKIRNFLYALIVVGLIICFFNIVIGLVIVVPLVIFIASLQTAKDIKHEKQDFNGKIKEELAPKIIKLALPDAERFMDEGVSKEEYIESEFVNSCDEYFSHDKIITPLVIDGEKVKEIELYDVSHEITEEANDSFYGIFVRVQLPKDIRTKIKIASEGKYVKGNVFKYDIENQAFEGKFDVMAMNKNIVKDVINDRMMECMLEIYSKYKYLVEINLIRNMLYLRVIGRQKVIQAKDGSEIDRLAVDNHYNIMKEVSELIHIVYETIDKAEI